MSNPIIADNKPVKVRLSKGQEYHFARRLKSWRGRLTSTISIY